MRLILFLTLSFAIFPCAVSADPVSAAIVSALGAFGVTVTAAAVTTFLVNTALSLGLSLLSQALAKRKGGEDRGIRVEGTTVGEDVPQKFPIGRYMTGGHLEYHGSFGTPDGGPPNKWYARVFSVSDVPGVSLRRLMISDEWTDLGTVAVPDWGVPILKYRRNGNDYAFLRFYDGTQTEADPLLVEKFSSDPDHPWTVDHIGHGVAYAVVMLHVDSEQFQGIPQCRFELDGVPLYDPRKDTSAGGSGAHRHDNPSTWEPSENLAVQAYNLFRGIPLPDGNTYGGDSDAEDVPFSNWVAGMNECDVDLDGRPQFTGGLEIHVDEEPAAYIEELLAAGLGQVSEVGGVFRSRWGAPDTPVLEFSDDDISISDPQKFDPFPGLEETYNSVRITHPSPDHLWEPIQTPAEYNATWEAEDGGRRLPVQMDVPACFDHGQAQQIAAGYAADHRRWRRHTLTLPPDAFDLSALDSVSWTSPRNGYVNKIFEVVGISYRPFTLFCDIHLRERDPDDYDWTGGQELPAPPVSIPVTPTDRVVGATEWSFSGIALRDGTGEDRRPALRIDLVVGSVEDADAVDWQIELVADESHVAAGAVRANEDGVTIGQGILPNTQYRARIRPRMRGRTSWTSWKSTTTPDVRIVEEDLSAVITQSIDDAQSSADAAAADALQALTDAAAAQSTADLAVGDASAVQSELDGLLAGYSGVSLEQSLDDLLSDAEAYTDTSEAALNSRIDRNAQGVFTFEAGGSNWTRADAPLDNPVRVLDADIVSTDKGFAVQSAGFEFVNPVPVLPLVAGRTYEFEILVRCTVDSTVTGGSREKIIVAITHLNADGSIAGYAGTAGVDGFYSSKDPLRVADGWVTLKCRYTPSGGAAGDYIRPRLYACWDSSGTYGDMTWQVAMFRYQDVTSAQVIEADLQNNYYTAVNTDAAIAARELILQGQIDDTDANLTANYYTAVETDSAIAARELILQGQIDDTDANLTANYYTAASTDAAIAARELILQGQIDGTDANLTANYYTSAETDSAVALSDQTLQANIDTTRAMDLPTDFTDGDKFWASSVNGSPKPAGETGAADAVHADWSLITSGNGYRVMNLAPTEINGNTRYMCQRGVFTPVPGRRYRIRVYCTLWGTVTSGTPKASLFFRKLDKDYTYLGEAPGFSTKTLTVGGWHMYETEVLCDDSNADAFWRAGMYVRGGDFTMDTATGGFNIQSLEVDDVTEVESLSGEITDIRNTDVNALTGTALATLFTQLNTDSGGTSATVTSLLGTQSDVDGFALAFAGLTVETSSGKIAGFKATSWSDPDGTGGAVLELLGDVIAEGTMAANKLVVGLGKNLLENSDFIHGVTSFEWLTSGAVGSGADHIIRNDGNYSNAFYPTIRLRTYANNSTGGHVSISFRPASDNAGALGAGYICTPGEFFEFSAQLAVRRVNVAMRVYWYNSAGEEIGNTLAYGNNWGSGTEGSNSDLASWFRYGGIVEVPADLGGQVPAFCRPNVRIIGTDVDGGAQVADLHILRPMFAKANSLEDRLSPYSPSGTGLWDGGRLVADSITAQSGVIADLAVGRLKLATGSVTELVRLSKTDSTTVAYNAGSRTTSQSDVNTYYAANGTTNMHHVTSAKLSYTVPSTDPPEKLLIMPSARMGMTFWDYNTGASRAYNLTAGTRVRVDGSDALGFLVPGSNYSFYRTAQMSTPLIFEYPDVLLELGTDYSAGDVIDFDVFVYRGDNGANFLFGFNMREHTVDIMEFYK
ncbi:phage tail protein [Leisingera sp.]|uniref:phage tail protein n=1 Tax=Leisingera sp. TaxID=1879318 RepID=UPI002B267313|nr:phage tail protein [Leisingera sp.]